MKSEIRDSTRSYILGPTPFLIFVKRHPDIIRSQLDIYAEDDSINNKFDRLTAALENDI